MRKSILPKSFQYALRGLAYVYRHEKNFRIELFFSILVFLSFLIFSFTRVEIVILILLCAFILILEIVNSGIERFLDIIKPRMSYQVEVVKDILAGMVFLAVLFSIVVGLLIYIPAFVELLTPFVIQ